LRTAVDICFGSAFASCVWWGRDLVQLYNDAALAILRGRHPAAFATPADQCWSDVWPVGGPLVERVLSTGEPALREDMAIPLDREGTRDQAWFTFCYSALRDESGAVAGLFITAIETTARVRSEAARLASETRAKSLSAELQHRVRNTLAVVRAIARKTSETSTSAEASAMHLDARLSAFARVQAAVIRNPGVGVDLELLIAEELHAAGAAEGEQVRPLAGPKVRLQPKAAETLALAVHELATNALKYGALSAGRGRVVVEWRIEPAVEPRLVLEWTETGVGMPERPMRRGFGAEMIERTLPYDLGGEASLHFEPCGVRCRIAVPLTGLVLSPSGP
jgi:two-component sensor histidine kinase